MPIDNNITNSQEQNAATNQEAENQNQDIKGDNSVKNPDEWTTGNEPMTGAQKSYLKTLSDEAGETLNDRKANNLEEQLYNAFHHHYS